MCSLCSSMKRVLHFNTSALEGASKMAKPPITSLASAKGPSVTVIFPLLSLMSVPCAVGSRPPLPTMTQPAFVASSSSLLIASYIADGTSNGASLCFTMVINRMGISPLFDQLVSTGDLLAQPAVMLDGWALAEIVQLEHRPDLYLTVPLVRIGAAFDPFDR